MADIYIFLNSFVNVLLHGIYFFLGSLSMCLSDNIFYLSISLNFINSQVLTWKINLDLFLRDDILKGT